MKNDIAAAIEQHFSDLTEPRHERTMHHKLLDIIVIAICAVICGADDWEDVAEFGRARLEWFETFLDLPNGIPSHDTFGRVFARLDPQQFQACFMRWITAVSEVIGGEVIAMDGKYLRGSQDKGIGKGAIDMVSAWAVTNRLVLGQIKVDNKSNEITAIPELLRALDVAGCIVTIDAIGCQTDIAEQIVDKEADYVLALKKNQGHLYEDVERLFEDLQQSNYKAYAYDYEKTVDKDHGRLEIRECWTISDAEVLRYLRGSENWKKLNTVSRIRSQRWIGDEKTVEDRYHIASIVGAKHTL